uniref:Uncharacterized protein n=1 Tax=mine drainage metagenome TaxID=410659 RepID=E6Q7F8_9ZZZZ
MFGGVNLLAILIAILLASMAMRTTSSQWMLRLALLWCMLVVLARGILIVDRTLPGGWTWKIVEILPAVVLLGISLLRREPQRFGAYPWARRNGSGDTP